MKQSFLFLQGVASPFFAELGKALKAAGHEVVRVNYCGGDFISGRYFTAPVQYINFRGDCADHNALETFYHAIYSKYKITDIVLFGDTRPVHAPALALAKKTKLTIHVYEEGYFRPNLITLDNGGVNANSALSKNPKDYSGFANDENNISQVIQPTGGGLAIRAWHDIRYHAMNLLFTFYFPHYQSHRPVRALKEYWGWTKRFPSLFFFYNSKAKQDITKLLLSKKDYYLLPLQLDADSQMRIHSPIKTVTDLIETTIQSFAKHAPSNSKLVIKVHPLDPWFINYSQLISATAKRYSISKERIIHLESGDLNPLLIHSKGTVLVNSTVGTSALSLGCPVIALGTAIYDMEGLTFQGTLDDFWMNSVVPDPKLFEDFREYILHHTQINGSFYNQKGIEMAVQGSIKFLTRSKHLTHD